jgi:3-oxoacyl-[acyl-carrier-protein] synthase-3
MHDFNSFMSEITKSGRSVVLSGIRVAGVYGCVPRQVIDNACFEKQFGPEATSDVVKMIGVKERRWVNENVTGGDLTLVAAQGLLAKLGWPSQTVDVIIYVSQTPDFKMPSTACVLQHRLGLAEHCAAFDLNLGCSAYPYALWTAMSLLRASGLQRALVCVSETMSKIIDQSDRATAMLFGDAATVTALEVDGSDIPSYFMFGTKGSGYSDLIIADGARVPAETEIVEKGIARPDKLHMDGWSVFNFTIGTVPGLVKQSLTQASLETNDVDYFLFHQANNFMLDHLSKKSKLPSEKILKNIANFGNTSCASIPLLMATELSSFISQRTLTLALFGFGVGYSWSSAVLRVDDNIILDWIEA